MVAPTPSVATAHQEVMDQLPFEDRSDFERASRGFIATREDPGIMDDEGKVIMDLSWFDFMEGEAISGWLRKADMLVP